MRNKNGVILHRMNAHVYNIIHIYYEVTRENMAGYVFIYIYVCMYVRIYIIRCVLKYTNVTFPLTVTYPTPPPPQTNHREIQKQCRPNI